MLHNLFSKFLVLFLFTFVACNAKEHFRIEVLHGKEALTYYKQVSALANAVYRESPYFYDSSEEGWNGYLESYVNSPKSIFAIAMKDGVLIGAAYGTALTDAREKYNQAFANHPEYLEHLFYFGEIAVKPEFRKQGLGKKLYKKLERAVKKEKSYSGICLWQMKDYTDIAPFCRKLGFTQRGDIQMEEMWKNVDGTEKVAHPMICWMKLFKK